MKKRIHILGASGSGTTTLASIVSRKLGYEHFDSDDYFWLDTNNSFTKQRKQAERLTLVEHDLNSQKSWILSSSLTGWGDSLCSYFDLVIFIYVPQELRMQRLKEREYERYGDRIFPGGSRFESSRKFLKWCSSYEKGTRNGRSLKKYQE